MTNKNRKTPRSAVPSNFGPDAIPRRPPRRRIPLTQPETNAEESPPASPSVAAPFYEDIPLSDDDLAGEPEMPQQMIDAWHDDEPENAKVGYKKPPKGSQFQKGRSGNPSGKRKKKEPRPGNVLQRIGHEVVDEVIKLSEGRVGDLKPNSDDLVTTLLAKIVIGDGLKKDGTARKFLFSQFLEKPLQSEYLAPASPGQEDATLLGRMAHAIIDPTITDEDVAELMREVAESRETDDEFGARRRKERRKRRKTSRAN